MKTLAIALLILCSQVAMAGNAVLLTSLELYTIPRKYIETRFKRAIAKSDLTPVIKHMATPKDLYEVMTSPETEVLIWVSHANKDIVLKPGMKGKAIIADAHGNNVKSFFTLTPPHLRFLGLVGCSAGPIIENFKNKGYYDHAPELKIMAFDENKQLYKAFNQTLKELRASLDLPQVEHLIPDEKKLNITRFMAKSLTSDAWVEFDDQVIAFFEASETEKESRILNRVWTSLENKNIHYFGENDFGFLQITIDGFSPWKLFALPNGKAIGAKNQQLYIYKP